MAYSKVIGDQQSKATTSIVTAIPVPVVASASIADKDHAVNNALQSGKKLGAMLADKSGFLYIATGDAPTDKWKKVSATDVTPS